MFRNMIRLGKDLRKIRNCTVLFLVFAVLAAVNAVNLIVYLNPWVIVMLIAFVALAFLVFRKLAALKKAYSESGQPIPSGLHEMYSRKAYNSLFFGFFAAAVLVYSGVCVSAANSKPGETAEFFLMNVVWFELIAVICGKNIMMAAWTRRSLPEGGSKLKTRYIIIICLVSVIFWGVLITYFRLFNTSSWFTFYAVSVLYIAFALFFDTKILKRIDLKGIKIGRFQLITALLILLIGGGYLLISRDVWLTQPFINKTANISSGYQKISYDDDSGIYTITKDRGDYRILQLTDIHLGGSITSYGNDLKALQACFDLIEYAKPDLVVVTGDLCFPLGLASFSLNNTAPVMQFASFMRNVGIPWAFTFGNHDTEALAATDSTGLNELYKSLSYKTSRNLLYPYVQPDIHGRNNQLIEIRNSDGSLFYGLFLLDSNTYLEAGFSDYDYIRDDQVDWYKENVLRMKKETGRTVPSLAFFHIPIREYETAYDLYLEGSSQVKYYFGENNEGEICCPDHDSSFFDTAVELGSTKGTFCGHDHYNNMSLEYKGIRLTYGMSIDYLVMPGIGTKTAQRGATLILLGGDGSMELKQIPYESIK